MKRCLVTGGAGFIGSHLVDELLKKKYKVIVLDNLVTGNLNNLSLAFENPNFEFYKENIINFKKIEKYFTGIDEVYHLAGLADIKKNFLNSKKDFDYNLKSTFNILEAMKKNNVKKIIHSSSSAVLGIPTEYPTNEKYINIYQNSIYGANKLASENLISSYCYGFNMKGISFRFVSITGERYSHGHIWDFYHRLKKNSQVLNIMGNGLQKKSFLDVKDCVRGIILLSNHKKINGFNIFNLGSFDTILIKDSAKIILKSLNLEGITKLKFEKSEIGWLGDSPVVHLDISKAKEFGWEPKIPLQESIFNTVLDIKKRDN